jgi:hypothetical protein
MIMNDEFERMWKEVVVEYFTKLSQHNLAEGTDKNHNRLRMSGVRTENRTWDLKNSKQKC